MARCTPTTDNSNMVRAGDNAVAEERELMPLVSAYGLVWCLWQVLSCNSPPQPAHLVLIQAPLVVAALLNAEPWVLCLAMLANIGVVMWSSPVLQDHHQWSMQTDLAVVVFVALSHTGHITHAKARSPQFRAASRHTCPPFAVYDVNISV